ncbi:MAG: hypothetical protein P4L51_21795 [Puia sp.]|nr:hypothetical protein [Puia sp.]
MNRFDTPQEKKDKTKVIKKLVAGWIARQETRSKAALLIAKNPEVKSRKVPAALWKRA